MNLTPSEIAFAIANTAGCVLACWYALTGINACTRKTHIGARASFAAIAIGSFAMLLNPPDLDAAGVASTAIVAGLGIGFLANRRKCVCLNCQQRPGPRQPTPIDWRELHADRRAADRNSHHNPGSYA